MKKHFELALQYVRDNKTWYDDDESAALRRIDYMRCNLASASPVIDDAIRGLMDEYGRENDLPDDWWARYSTDDIFYKL